MTLRHRNGLQEVGSWSRNRAAMAANPGQSGNHDPALDPSPSTGVWAFSASVLGFVYAALLGLTSILLFLTLFWIVLPLTLPAMALSVGFIYAGFAVRTGRDGARSLLRACAAIAAIGNIILIALCLEFLASDHPVAGTIDYRVVALLVAVAQSLYCLGLVRHLRPRASASGLAAAGRSLSPKVQAVCAAVVSGVVGTLAWIAHVEISRPRVEPVDAASRPSAVHSPGLRRKVQTPVSQSGGRTSPPPGGAQAYPALPSSTRRQGIPPSSEQLRDAVREAEQAQQTLLKEWIYPGARVIPFEPRTGSVAFPTMALHTTDDLQAVIRFYDRLAFNGRSTEKGYILDGKRPRDGQPTEIWIGKSQGEVFIRFDTRRSN